MQEVGEKFLFWSGRFQKCLLIFQESVETLLPLGNLSWRAEVELAIHALFSIHILFSATVLSRKYPTEDLSKYCLPVSQFLLRSLSSRMLASLSLPLKGLLCPTTLSCLFSVTAPFWFPPKCLS